MRLALVTEVRTDRRTAWSGTILYMAHALRDAGAEIQMLDPVLEGPTRALGVTGKVMRRLIGIDPMFNRSRSVARVKAAMLCRRLRGVAVDALFAPVGSTLIAEIPPGVPIIYTSDATLRLMQGYYDRYGPADRGVSARAIASERSALHRATLLVYPTHWAAASAIADYGVNPARILVQSFGANLPDPPERAAALQPRRDGPLRLLFCGVEWLRKGGDTTLAALAALRRAGVAAELTIVGCTPPPGALDDPALADAVTVIPYLNKAIPAERARFRAIFLDADMLILPTQAECYGLVFCEAAACGTVSAASATGGIPEVIRNGKTGLLLPVGASGADYADAIRALAGDPVRLAAMRKAARDDFETRLNWGIWGRAVLDRFRSVIAEQPA